MSSTGRRLDRLYPALSAKERALLALRTWKRGEAQDPAILTTMPREQAAEYNRYVSRMRGAGGDVTLYIVVLDAYVGQLDLKHAWLQTLRLWAMHDGGVRAYLQHFTKEPVTAEEHRKLVEKARARLMPTAEAAEVLLAGEEAESEAAWRRKLSAKREEVEALVADGTLASARRGRRVFVRAGAFYDWLGESVPLRPDFGCGYEVVPDGDVETLRSVRAHAKDALDWAPREPDGLEPWSEERDGPARLSDAMAALVHGLGEGIALRWRELRAVELVVEEVAQELDGEDPLHPQVRAMLTEDQERLRELAGELESCGRTVELGEPDDAQVAQVRRLRDMDA